MYPPAKKNQTKTKPKLSEGNRDCLDILYRNTKKNIISLSSGEWLLTIVTT